jgi:excisionase family DNA binding protein
MDENHLSLSEAAGRLDISERTARRWIRSGKLRAYKPGRDYWIPESAIREVIEQSEVRPKVPSRSQLEPSLFNDGLAEGAASLTDDRRWLQLQARRGLVTVEALGRELNPADMGDEVVAYVVRHLRGIIEEKDVRPGERVIMTFRIFDAENNEIVVTARSEAA